MKMAFSREKAFQVWIKKLKYRHKRYLELGMSYDAGKLEQKIKEQVRRHGV